MTPRPQFRFSLDDYDYPFVGLSSIAECHIELQDAFPVSADQLSERYLVRGALPERLAEAAAWYDLEDVRERSREGALATVEFVRTGETLISDLATCGAALTGLEASEGTGTVEFVVPEDVEPTAVLERVLDAHPALELEARREVEQTPATLGPAPRTARPTIHR